MKYLTCSTCDFKYNPSNDFTHTLTKMHLDSFKKYYFQKRILLMDIIETTQIMVCQKYGKTQHVHKNFLIFG